jgi:hypothetical protein
MDVRKYVDVVEEIRMENGKPVNPPVKKAGRIIPAGRDILTNRP